MSLKDKEKWNSKYSADEYIANREPCEWLMANAGLLNSRGEALDIAMGEGRNAVFVAALGYNVVGVDISEAGIHKAKTLADEKNVRFTSVQTDLDNYKISENSFDLILCFNFLDRRLFPEICRGLKPGGFIFYETFTIDHLKHSSFKKEWVLAHNELLKAFSELRVLRYREIDQEQKAVASLVAQK